MLLVVGLTLAADMALVNKYAPIWVYSTNTKYFHTSPLNLYQAITAPNKKELYFDKEKLTKSDKNVLFEYLTREDCPNLLADVVINYWRYHMKQDSCFLSFGSHWHDWERISVLIKNGTMIAVTFHQHSGHYTKFMDEVQLYDFHPVVYVSETN